MCNLISLNTCFITLIPCTNAGNVGLPNELQITSQLSLMVNFPVSSNPAPCTLSFLVLPFCYHCSSMLVLLVVISRYLFQEIKSTVPSPSWWRHYWHPSRTVRLSSPGLKWLHVLGELVYVVALHLMT